MKSGQVPTCVLALPLLVVAGPSIRSVEWQHGAHCRAEAASHRSWMFRKPGFIPKCGPSM